MRVQLNGGDATVSAPVKLRDTIKGIEGWNTVDGQRFLTVESVDERPDPSPIHVIVNWTMGK